MGPAGKKIIKQFFYAMGHTAAGQFTCIAGSFFLIELLSFILLSPSTVLPVLFGFFWSLLLAGFVLLFPRKLSRVVFGISFFTSLLWTLAQAGYYHVFGKMMWLSTLLYAGEGAVFIWDVLIGFPLHWWLLGITAGLLGGFVVRYYPQLFIRPVPRFSALICLAVCVLGLLLTPAAVFAEDIEPTEPATEEETQDSYAEAYDSMLNAKAAYDVCGVYQLTFRDLLVNKIYPLTENYEKELIALRKAVDEYFQSRKPHKDNEMTGIHQGKNVIFVLMESMDDWLIDPVHTPTIYQMMENSLNFTNFYTPGFGGARTLNSEFCMNTGVFLPASGSYVFDYIENSFDQSIAGQLTANGYTAEVFHYNDGDFYSREVLEPALGYRSYNSFADYATNKELLDEELLFDIPEMKDKFFRSGLTFNTVITRSAHMGYTYSEKLSKHAFSVYPQYKGMFDSEEEDCARAKARLVDDFFGRLLQELKAQGTLENTLIVAMTDHYTYGYQDDQELLAHSGLDRENAILLEKTPCFIWSYGGPSAAVEKTLNTADLVPTVLNLLGITSPYSYIGQDAFDPDYPGYAVFPDGSWISDGVVCILDEEMEYQVICDSKSKRLTPEQIAEISQTAWDFVQINDLLMLCDYYAKTHLPK